MRLANLGVASTGFRILGFRVCQLALGFRVLGFTVLGFRIEGSGFPKPSSGRIWKQFSSAALTVQSQVYGLGFGLRLCSCSRDEGKSA